MSSICYTTSSPAKETDSCFAFIIVRAVRNTISLHYIILMVHEAPSPSTPSVCCGRLKVSLREIDLLGAAYGYLPTLYPRKLTNGNTHLISVRPVQAHSITRGHGHTAVAVIDYLNPGCCGSGGDGQGDVDVIARCRLRHIRHRYHLSGIRQIGGQNTVICT